jgi:lambda family phage tail tape measure protein
MDNRIVIDISDVEKAKISLRELSAQLGVSGNAATQAEGKIKAMAEAMKAANAAPFTSGLLLLTAALGGAAVAAKGFMDSFVESAANLNNLSTKTGIAVEQLSIMSSVAKLSGTSMDTVTGAVMKFEKSLASSSKETSIQAKAFKELGINTSDTSKTTEQYLAMAADKLSGLHDGWQKNNIVMALFGKTGTDINEFLGDYAERGDLAAKVTAEQAAQAEAYERTMRKLEATTNAYKALIGSALMPVAKALSDEFLAMAGNVNKLDQSQKDVLKNDIATWAFGIAKALAAGIDVGVMFMDMLNGTAKAIGVLIASMVTMGDVFKKVLSGDFSGAWELAKTNASLLKDGMKDAWETATQGSTKYYDMVIKAEGRFQAEKGKKVGADTRPNPKNIGSDEGSGPKDRVADSGYTAALLREQEAIIKLRGELSKLNGVQQETHSQLLKAEIDAGKYAGNMDKSKGAIRAAATEQELAMLKTNAAIADSIQATINKTKHEKDLWAQVEKNNQAEDAKVTSLRKSINEGNIQREVMRRYGATQNDVNIAINNFNIAQAQTALTMAELTNASEQEISTLRKRLEVLRELGVLQQDKKEDDDAEAARQKTFSYGWEQSFNKYKEDAENAAGHAQTVFGAASKGMESAITNFVKTGKMDFADLASSIINSLIQIQAQKMTASLMSSLFSADGNVFDNGNVLKSADGNVFDSPTLHGYSGGIGMIGEAGPESVMPLKRNAQGQLGVIAQGGNSSSNVTVTNHINVQGTNSSMKDSIDQARLISNAIDMKIKQSLAKEQLPGGMLSSASRRF